MNLGLAELLIVIFAVVVPLTVTIVIVVLVAKAVGNSTPQLGTQLPMGAQQGTDGWAPDPTGRHQLRWQRSGVWSAQVSDNGVVSDDPI